MLTEWREERPNFPSLHKQSYSFSEIFMLVLVQNMKGANIPKLYICYCYRRSLQEILA